MKTNYTYKAVGTLIARYVKSTGMANNPIVMKKTYMLDEETDIFTGDSILSRKYNINLDPYRNEFERFVETVTIPISIEIRIDFIISLQRYYGGKFL